MFELVLHTDTKHELEAFVRRPAHALLIIGPEGSGKRSISETLATQILEITDSRLLGEQPQVRIIEPEKASISIETVRGLIQFTKLKIAGNGEKIRRIILMDDAGSMTSEAQNALLKLLEEPPADTIFLLNADRAESLLPTVRSRSQQLAIKQPGREALESFFAGHGFTAKQIQSAYLMSGGLPGLMSALLHDEDSHPLVHAAAQARELLRAKAFERLCMVDTFARQKTECLKILFILQMMAHAALANAAKNGSSDRALKQWQKILHSAYNAENALNSQAQAKLVLTNFMFELS